VIGCDTKDKYKSFIQANSENNEYILAEDVYLEQDSPLGSRPEIYYNNYFKDYIKDYNVNYNGFVPLLKPIDNKLLWIKPEYENGYVPLVNKVATTKLHSGHSSTSLNKDTCFSTFWSTVQKNMYNPQPFYSIAQDVQNNYLVSQQWLLGMFSKKNYQYKYLPTLEQVR